jgi:hypothetical protein
MINYCALYSLLFMFIYFLLMSNNINIYIYFLSEFSHMRAYIYIFIKFILYFRFAKICVSRCPPRGPDACGEPMLVDPELETFMLNYVLFCYLSLSISNM